LRNNDQQFFDSFVIVLGLLMATAIGLYFAARSISNHTVALYETQDPLVQQEIEKRIAPIAHVALMGGAELKAAQAAAAAAAAPKPSAVKLTGEQVFHQVCYACHAPPGAAGAPVIGNHEMWDSRVAEGLQTLEQHALHGFQGQKGIMPPKGGRPDLPDDEIVAAVHYMVSQVAPDVVKKAESAAGKAAK
jgi:cytochrome c5